MSIHWILLAQVATSAAALTGATLGLNALVDRQTALQQQHPSWYAYDLPRPWLYFSVVFGCGCAAAAPPFAVFLLLL